jgi:anti-sigma factor RsiW
MEDTMTMSCGRARRLLWPDAGPREVTPETVAAREHAAGCEACTRFLEDMRRIAARIGQAAPRPTAPAEVRGRLFKAIARARTDSASPGVGRFRPVLVAASAALVVGLGWLGYIAVRGGASMDDALGSIMEDRLRAQKGAGLASADSLQVARWLGERLPFSVQVPLFPGARLTGARLLVDNRQSGAVVEYVVSGSPLTYYVVPGGAGLQRQVQLASREGYRVASWHDAGLTHALVATLPGPRLIEYARYCIHQMMASAAGRLSPGRTGGGPNGRPERRGPYQPDIPRAQNDAEHHMAHEAGVGHGPHHLHA